jgi:hypothetical protein
MPVFRLPTLSESHITQQVRDYMELHGWRPVRMQRTIVPGQFSTCEPGTADFLFIYYLEGGAPGRSLCLWVELKRPKARMRCRCLENLGTRKRCTACDQKAWRERERERGAIVWTDVVDIQTFIEAYERTFGFLHSGDRSRGQLDLLAGA